MKCPKCGRFVSNIYALVNGNGDIKEVNADCKRCGVVHPRDWDYETFFPEVDEPWILNL